MCSTQRLQSQQCSMVATEQQPRSSLRACNELTAKEGWWLHYFGWVKHFPSQKRNWSWIRNNLRLMNSAMISYVNSFPRIALISYINSIMNSYMISLLWIHWHEFRDEFTHKFWHMISRYSSWLWIHIWIHVMNSDMISWSWIHMQHFMTCEFIYEFMYMKNMVKSYLKWCLTRFQMNSWRRITWKLWKVTYPLSRIPAFVGNQ